MPLLVKEFIVRHHTDAADEIGLDVAHTRLPGHVLEGLEGGNLGGKFGIADLKSVEVAINLRLGARRNVQQINAARHPGQPVTADGLGARLRLRYQRRCA